MKIDELFADEAQSVKQEPGQKMKIEDVFADEKENSGDGIFTSVAEKPKPKGDGWWNYAKETLGNVPSSAGKAVGDVVTAIVNPVETVKGVGYLAEGVIQHAAAPVIRSIFNLEKVDTPEMEMASQVGKFYTDRYGSLEKAAETFKKDPVGFLSDLSTVVSGGAGIVAKGAKLGKLSKVASTASKVAKIADAADPIVAASKGLTTLAGKGVNRLFKPTIDTAAVEAAKRAGVTLTAGASTKSKIVPVLEAFSEKSLFGGDGMSKRVADAKDQIQAFADDIKMKAGPDADVVTVGNEMVAAKDAFHEKWIDGKTRLYDDATIDPDIVIDPTKTKQFVDDVLAKRESAGKVLGKGVEKNPFTEIRDSLSKTKTSKAAPILDQFGNPVAPAQKSNVAVSLADFKEAIRQLNEEIKFSKDPVVTGNKATLKKLAATMSEEFDDALMASDPQTYQKLKDADKFYQEGISVLDSNIGRTIENYRNTPSLIVEKLASSKTAVEDIDKIAELLGDEAMPKIRRAVVEDIIDTARSSADPDGFFTAAGIRKGINKYGDRKLEKIVGTDLMKNLTDIDTVVKAINKGEKIVGGSQTAWLAQVSALAATAAVNPLAALGMALGNSQAAKFIASDAGQAMLATGKFNGIPGFDILKTSGKGIDVNHALRLMREGLRQAGSFQNDENAE